VDALLKRRYWAAVGSSRPECFLGRSERPAAGFFIWLNMRNFGGGSDAALTLWKRGGVKVVPGAFLAQAGRDGTNPGDDYVRLALVHDAATVREALERFVVVLA
jgi:aspartate/methionine/tyrosine aminotransferase